MDGGAAATSVLFLNFPLWAALRLLPVVTLRRCSTGEAKTNLPAVSMMTSLLFFEDGRKIMASCAEFGNQTIISCPPFFSFIFGLEAFYFFPFLPTQRQTLSPQQDPCRLQVQVTEQQPDRLHQLASAIYQAIDCATAPLAWPRRSLRTSLFVSLVL